MQHISFCTESSLLYLIIIIIAFGPYWSIGCLQELSRNPDPRQPLKLSTGVTHPLYFSLQIVAPGVSWAASLSLSLWAPGQGLMCDTGHWLLEGCVPLYIYYHEKAVSVFILLVRKWQFWCVLGKFCSSWGHVLGMMYVKRSYIYTWDDVCLKGNSWCSTFADIITSCIQFDQHLYCFESNLEETTWMLSICEFSECSHTGLSKTFGGGLFLFVCQMSQSLIWTYRKKEKIMQINIMLF